MQNNFYKIFHLLIGLFLFFSANLFSQADYYSDFYRGGVTGAGYSIGAGGGDIDFSTVIELNIPSGATIRNAFMIVSEDRLTPVDYNFLLNGFPFHLGTDTKVTSYTIPHSASEDWQISTHIVDVTSAISPAQSIQTLTLPNQNRFADIYRSFYLIVLYETSIGSKTAFNIFLNDEDIADSIQSWTLQPITSYNSGADFSLILNTDIICNTHPVVKDGEFVSVENNLIGLIGGSDASNGFLCAGVKGHFYYENGILTGLDDDIADITMSQSDGIAIINNYLPQSASTVNLRFDCQQPIRRKHNNPISFFLAYTTPCDTFSVSVPSDTMVCAGTQLQLNVTGGQNYEWLATNAPSGAPGLSCTDCPNPVFTADSSMHYTVRIWNNDSCSVVRPIHILVNDLQIDSTLVSSADCGASNGEIEVFHDAFSWQQTELYVDGVLQASDTLASNLAEGTYTLHLEDEMGCVGPAITINLPAVNTTIAQFGLDPLYGNAPLAVNVYQLSHNATNYEWYVNGDFVGNSLSNYTLPNGGEYTFELVAWQYDPACADTFSMGVFVTEIVIPTAFTPDNDGVNDTWEIQGFTEYLPKATVKIFNRWGDLLYEVKDGKYPQYPWDGTFNGEKLPTGSYFYLIEPNNYKEAEWKGTVSVLR